MDAAGCDPSYCVLLPDLSRTASATFDNRYAVTATAVPIWTDPEPASGTTHTYWVTAVDEKFNESDPLGPLTWHRAVNRLRQNEAGFTLVEHAARMRRSSSSSSAPPSSLSTCSSATARRSIVASSR